MRRSVLSLLAALCVLGFAATGASAAVYNWKSTLVVPNNLAPDDLHVVYINTGGTVANIAVVPAPTTAVPNGLANGIDVVWPAKLAGGTKVTITFTTTNPNVTFNNGTWTNGGATIGNITQSMVEHTWVTRDGVPGTSPAGMALLALLIAGAGSMIIMRRRQTA